MASIRITQFGGLVPDLASRIKPETHASIAHNCLLEDGSLRPQAKWVRQGFYNAGVTPTIRSIVFDPSTDRAAMYTTYDTVLCTGEPMPKNLAYGADLSPSVSKHIANQGLTKTTAAVYNFGIVADVTYIPGNLSTKPLNRVYAFSRVRFVNGRREEGGLAALAGLPTDIVYEGDNAQLDITFSALDDGATHVRIYRSLTGLDTGDNVQNELDTEWHLVAEIPLNGAEEIVYIDGGAITTDPLDVNFSQQFHPPTIAAEFFGLTESGWFVCASRSGEVQISERYMPHAWPSENTLNIQQTVTDMAIHGDNVYLGTKGFPFIIPIAQGEKGVQAAAIDYKESYPCEEGSMTTSSSGVIYASTSGLIALSRDGLQVITGEISNPGDKLFTRKISAIDSPTEEQQKIVATFGDTNHGAYFKGKYYGFCGPVRADMFYLTTEIYEGTFYLTTLEYPDVATLALWTMGDGVAQKMAPGAYPFIGPPVSTANFDIGFSSTQRNNTQVHRDSGRVFISSLDAVWVYTSGQPEDPIGVPVEFAYTQNMLVLGTEQAAVDQDTGTFTIVGGQFDTALLIFSDDTTQTLTFPANSSPHMVVAMGDGKFAYYCLDDGLVYVYGPSNAYAAPLLTTVTPVFIGLACAIDVAGSRLFISSNDNDEIAVVNLVTGAVTTINTGGRCGYRLKYMPSIDRLVMDNMDDVADDGKIFVIDPSTGVELTIDFATEYNLRDGYDYDPGSFKDMGVVDNMVTLIAEFSFGGGPTFHAALMLNCQTGQLMDAYELSGPAYSVCPNERDGEFYFGTTNAYEVGVFKVGGPYGAYIYISNWADPDTRFIAWL